jgi:hypothetical protein
MKYAIRIDCKMGIGFPKKISVAVCNKRIAGKRFQKEVNVK